MPRYSLSLVFLAIVVGCALATPFPPRRPQFTTADSTHTALLVRGDALDGLAPRATVSVSSVAPVPTDPVTFGDLTAPSRGATFSDFKLVEPPSSGAKPHTPGGAVTVPVRNISRRFVGPRLINHVNDVDSKRSVPVKGACFAGVNCINEVAEDPLA